ncbi:UDP-glucose 4-epimerase [Anaerolineales bacterium]|nr:UDP-glucose 4-epimerase [Anaerolineales bacterium]
MIDPAESFQGKNTLITGGLGFIGSNLAHRLLALGAKVKVVDAALQGTGANEFNLRDIRSAVEIQNADLRDPGVALAMIEGQDYLFNLAGLVSHVDSMESPQIDLEVNAACQLSIVQACLKHNPGIKIVYAGTRQIYGRSQYLPVDEKHPIVPVDFNGVTKRAGEMYHLVSYRAYGLHTTSLRMINTYGPRMHCRDGRLNFLGEWIRRLFDHQPLQVFGTGEQIRDLNFVDDVADALLLAASDEKSAGQIYNLGSPEPIRLLDLAQLMIEVFDSGSYELCPFPAERKRIDIGDYHGDYSKIQSQLGWQPKVSLREGLARTFEYYRQHREHYW